MSLPVRLGLFYSAIFIGVGAGSPYMPLWFAERGLSGAQIGLILSLPMIARVVTAPLLAVWADSFRLRRTALIFMMSTPRKKILGHVSSRHSTKVKPSGSSLPMVVCGVCTANTPTPGQRTSMKSMLLRR